jgi:hypothetical protein
MPVFSLAQLIWLAILLLIASKILGPKNTASDTRGTKIRKALSRIIRITSISAAIAALIVWIFPTPGTTNLNAQNIMALNETMASYAEILEYSWVVSLFLLLTAGLAVWAGWLDVKSAPIKGLRWSIKSTASAKLILGIVAACSFVASGVESGVENNLRQAKEVQQSLNDLQLAVFQRVEAVAEHEASASLLQSAGKVNANVTTLHAAYNQVASFLPDSKVIADSESTSDTRNAVAAPDISTDQANALLETYGRSPSAEESNDTLVNDVVGLIFDEKIADNVKKHFFGIANPLLSELASAFIDPIIAEPIKNAVSKKVSDAIRGNWSRAALRDAVDPVVAKGSAIMEIHLNKVPTSTAAGEVDQGFGDPVWNDLRDQLRLAVSKGLRNKDAATSASAKEVVERFAAFWGSAYTLFARRPDRKEVGERMFASYLLQNPDYSALWGYGVIALTPTEYEEDLRDLSVQDLVKSKGGKRKIATLRELLAHRDAIKAKDADFVNQILAPFAGIPPADVTDRQLAESLTAAHGSYPVDGYRLYFSKIDASQLHVATEYFRGDAVSTYVGKYCPAE